MLTIDFINKLESINKLFNSLDFSKKLKSKNILALNFIKRDNIEDKYLIVIYDDFNIDVTIPIKNSNYKYTTNFDSIENVYHYLNFHVNTQYK